MEAEKIQSFIRKHGFLRATSQLTLTCSFCQNLLHFWLPSPTASLTICGLDVSVRATPDLLCNGYRTRVRDVLCETQLWGTGLSSPAQDWLLVLSEPRCCRQILPCGICPSTTSSMTSGHCPLVSLSTLAVTSPLEAQPPPLGQSHLLQQLHRAALNPLPAGTFH